MAEYLASSLTPRSALGFPHSSNTGKMDVIQTSTAPGKASENRHAAIFAVGIGFIAFDSIVIGLRIYARAFMLHALGTDDILMVIGAILNFALSITIMVGSKYGIGKHALAIPKSDTVPMLKCIWATRILYTLSMGTVKMSLLWFYLRLDPRKSMRWAVFFVMFFNVALSLASFIGALASCSHPSLFWTNPTSSSCMPLEQQQLFYEVNGILNIVADILTYLLPVPMLYGLQLNWRKKGAILAIFGLGILSLAAACVRYDFVTKLASAREEYYLLLADSLNWCTIEAYVAIFCGCAPSLSAPIKAWAPSLFGSNPTKFPDSARLHRPSYLQRQSLRRSSRRRGLGETILESEDAIVTVSDCDPGSDGIMMKTVIQTDVAILSPTEELIDRRGCNEFARRV
ncbi:uncharacterized protein BO97DRAFT_397357 [Aspergillus homomorphus CBS 101889]|uniref:Rhodopsin domain-containing protein n=1 Tax=Aspergillus homomorphus (strain CBS 101889) TaxID=1450537 RepID=A0A395HLI9_ASPHC|nr:hypothetical protein BO97DRAFT_397357 [Aspergillus homomorphus CBS 101889]RAL08801.1 hypothetical protein BO97DRAFT_397357 [Aspergillus homomorphus CBS 101889]